MHKRTKRKQRNDMINQIDTSARPIAGPSFSTIEVQRLTEAVRPALAAHFRALPSDDLRLRFGAPISSERIEAYVAGIDFGRDAVFGVFDDELALIGVAHVGFLADAAELGISVLPGHR